MRILAICAFYPPWEIGGWDQLARDIVEGMRARGHEVHVLTSVYGTGRATDSTPHVRRVLRLQNHQVRYSVAEFLLRRRATSLHNLHAVREMIERLQPEVAMVHSMWNLSRLVPWQAEQLLPGRVAYYMADHWPLRGDVDEGFWATQAQRGGTLGWRRRLAGLALRGLSRERERYHLAFEHVAFVSHDLEQRFLHAGFHARSMQAVIHNGVEVHEFCPRVAEREGDCEDLLFVGNLSFEKGLHTLLEALALLARGPDGLRPRLRVVGPAHPHRAVAIRDLIAELGLAEQVQLLGFVARDRLPDLYRKARAVVFPSICEEALARVTQEAMACGLPVIATLTGGTGELVADGRNGLVFAPGDAEALAICIRRVWNDPALRRRLGEAARRTILDAFDIELTVERAISFLQTIAASRVEAARTRTLAERAG